ncbi:MAG: hypothetical protein ACXIU8_08160 [Alkalilacustris sp.]
MDSRVRGATRRALGAVAMGVLALCASPVTACPDWGHAPAPVSYSSDDLWVPRQVALTAGGGNDLRACPMPGVGHVATAPDLRLGFEGNGMWRDLVIRVEGSCDTVLLVNGPTGEWFFDDDTNGVDPELLFRTAGEGFYDIWVGTYEPKLCSATVILETFGAGPP